MRRRNSGEQRLIAQAWRYASELIDRNRLGLAGQREWLLARAPWLRQARPSESIVTLADGTAAALLPRRTSAGIGSQFLSFITEPVKRLVIISPYWDPTLTALSQLTDKLTPETTAILVDIEAASFPANKLGSSSNVRLFSRERFGKGRFIHAKAIIVETETADHMLLGSANCTVAALGIGDKAGVNEEVCFYRRLPPGSALSTLGLSDILTDGDLVAPSALTVPTFDDDLPFAELATLNPGAFESQIDVLKWQPPPSVNPTTCVIELLDTFGKPIECNLLALPPEPRALRFRISGTDRRPTFARLRRSDGSLSAPAIVALVDVLRGALRETHSRTIENSINALGEESEATLGLLEVHEMLERLQHVDDSPTVGISIPKPKQSSDTGVDSASFGTLPYDQFIKGRREPSAHSRLVNNSLTGSDTSIIRDMLNRILQMPLEAKPTDERDEDDAAFKRAFDLRDETDDPAAAIASGQDFDPKTPDALPADAANEIKRRRAARQKVTKDQIIKAVEASSKRIKERQKAGALDNQDLLRLRALLMIVCTSAYSEGADDKGDGASRSLLHVLPLGDDGNSWPLVIGRILFSMFEGREPAIRVLHLNAGYDLIPIDVMECWATCYWCLQACLLASAVSKDHSRIQQYSKKLAERTYLLTLPTKAEFLADSVMAIVDHMNERYALKLGIDPTKLVAGHRALVDQLFTSAKPIH